MRLQRGAARSMDDVAAGEREPLIEDDMEAMEAHVTASRYLSRDRPRVRRLMARGDRALLGQSGGKWNIKHNWGDQSCCISLKRLEGVFVRARRRMYVYSPFHTIVNLANWKVVVLCTVMYVIAWLVFALVYWLISGRESRQCDLVPDTAAAGSNSESRNLSFADAFFFSVETMATIGYGAPESIFFDACPMMAVAIPAQTIVGLVWDAVLLGLVFNRMSRGSPRGKTILFSDRAVVRKIRGKWHFMFQVCEVRKHALMEAHVRVYCVRKDLDYLATGSIAYFQPFAMRLQHPSDDLGTTLGVCVRILQNHSTQQPHAVYRNFFLPFV